MTVKYSLSVFFLIMFFSSVILISFSKFTFVNNSLLLHLIQSLDLQSIFTLENTLSLLMHTDAQIMLVLECMYTSVVHATFDKQLLIISRWCDFVVL